MATPPYTKLDADQVLKGAYDEAERRIRVDSTLSLDGGDLDVALDSTEDSIAIGNTAGTSYLDINPDGSINVVPGVRDNQIFSESTGSILAENTWTSVFSYTSTNDNTKIVSLECTANSEADFRVKIGGSVKRYLRTSPSQRNVEFKFNEYRALTDTVVLEVEAKVCRKYLNTVDTFVSMQGFINS